MHPRTPLPPTLAHTAFSTRDAAGVQIGRGRLRGNDLDHLFQGIYLPTSVELDLVTLCTSLTRRLPPTSFFSGITAAKLYGMPLPRRLEQSIDVHVAVVAPATAPVGRGIRGHSYRVVDSEIATVAGLRVSSPARAWCELSAVLSLDELIIAGDYLIHHDHGQVTRSILADQSRRFPARRGRATRAAALLEIHDRSDSPQETRLRLIVLRAHVEGVAVNFPIETSGGFQYRGDLAVPRKKVLIEYQSGFHDSPKQRLDDMTRRSRLLADGWTIIEFNANDLRDPVELVSRLLTLLAQ